MNFIGSMMVCPVDWSWSTSHSLSSSSTGGHTSDGAVLSSVGIAGVVRGGGRIVGGRRGPGRRGLGVRRPAGRIRVGSRSLSHRRPSFHSDTVLVLSQGTRTGRQVPLALCTTDTRFNVRNPAFEQGGGRLRADFCAPKRKKRPAQAYAGSGRLSVAATAAAGRPQALRSDSAGASRQLGGDAANQRLSCMTVLLTAVPPSTRQFAVMSCLPPATRSRSESDSSPSAAA